MCVVYYTITVTKKGTKVLVATLTGANLLGVCNCFSTTVITFHFCSDNKFDFENSCHFQRW